MKLYILTFCGFALLTACVSFPDGEEDLHLDWPVLKEDTQVNLTGYVNNLPTTIILESSKNKYSAGKCAVIIHKINSTSSLIKQFERQHSRKISLSGVLKNSCKELSDDIHSICTAVCDGWRFDELG